MRGDLGNNDLPSYHNKLRLPITNPILLTENNKVMIL